VPAAPEQKQQPGQEPKAATGKKRRRRGRGRKKPS